MRFARAALSEECLLECADRGCANDHEFNRFELDILAKEKQLYTYVSEHISNKLETAAMGTKSGVEVLRRVVREEGSATDVAEHGLRFSFHQMDFQNCHTISGTMKLVKAMATNV